MKIFAETDRLILREIIPSDVDGMYELDADPEVHTYLGKRPVTEKEESIRIIDFIRQQYTDHGIGRWAVLDKKSNDFIGWAGLKFVTDEINHHKNFYDLGYRLLKKYWGRGIATETAVATLKYAFNILETHEVYAMAQVENIGSNKVLTKVGLTYIETFNLHGIPHHWCKITKAEFESQTLPCQH